MVLVKKDIQLLKGIFATKDDLKRFATKDDLKRFATKDDLKELKNDLFNKLDSFLKEIIASRDEQTVIAHQISGHEDRLEKLEKIHPRGRHATPLP